MQLGIPWCRKIRAGGTIETLPYSIEQCSTLQRCGNVSKPGAPKYIFFDEKKRVWGPQIGTPISRHAHVKNVSFLDKRHGCCRIEVSPPIPQTGGAWQPSYFGGSPSQSPRRHKSPRPWGLHSSAAFVATPEQAWEGGHGRTIKHGVPPVTFQNKLKAYKTSIRARSLFDLLTDGIPSSPSGTSKSLPPVPLFTGTHDEQQTAKIAIRLLKEDLKINRMARTKPALLFRSKGLRFPLFEAHVFP